MLHWPWLLGDRQYAFTKEASTSDFPWLTARDVPDLVRFRARYGDPADPMHSGVFIVDPEGAEFEIRDPSLIARLSDSVGGPVRLLRLGRGCFDAMPLSIITTSMVTKMEQAHGGSIAVERFRANLVIEPDDPATTEQEWLERVLVVGAEGACLDVTWATPRCAMVGVDAVTGTRDPSVVRTVARRFGNQVGAYCSVRHPGRVRIGDAITLAAF